LPITHRPCQVRDSAAGSGSSACRPQSGRRSS
jgi:hypothetical protein